MSWTKRQFIMTAFEEIGISAYNFDLMPEMMEMASKRLDAMMAAWNAKGIRLAYSIPTSPGGDNLETDTGIPDSANEAVYLNLAIKLAPAFGKQISPDLKQAAFSAYNIMLAKNMDIPERQGNTTVPAGAGNKWRRFYSPYLIRPEDVPSDTDGDINFN